MFRHVLLLSLAITGTAQADGWAQNQITSAKLLGPGRSVSDAPLRSYKGLDTSLKFGERQPLAKEMQSNYRHLGERVVERLLGDASAGRRLKLDVEGKPGIGLEISF